MPNLDGSVHFDVNACRKGVKNNRFTNAPPGLSFDGDPGFPTNTGIYNKWWKFSRASDWPGM